MASMMHTCVGFVGLKWAHKQEIHTFPTLFKISRGAKVTKVPHFLAAWGSKNGFFDVKCCGPLFKNVLPATARSTFFTNHRDFFIKTSPNKPEGPGNGWGLAVLRV